MHSHSKEFLKITAVITLGIIACFPLFPYASGSAFRINEDGLIISAICAASIAIVIFSDRITSFKATHNSFEVHLETIRHDLENTLEEVKSNILRKEDPRITKAEQLITEPKERNLSQEAKDIGKAMRMLRQVMREYNSENV